jgi:RNA recognition motif-containing protein
MSIGLQVENLPGDAREDTLVDLLAGYGKVRVLRLVRSGVALTAVSRGVVAMGDGTDAARAAQALNGRYYRGRLLQVERVQVDS